MIIADLAYLTDLDRDNIRGKGKRIYTSSIAHIFKHLDVRKLNLSIDLDKYASHFRRSATAGNTYYSASSIAEVVSHIGSNSVTAYSSAKVYSSH